MKLCKIFVILLGLTAPLLGQQNQLDNVRIEDVTSQFPKEAVVSIESAWGKTVILTETVLSLCPAGSAQCAQPQKIVSENELPPNQKLVAKSSPTQGSYQTKLTLGERALYFASACPSSATRIYPDGSRVPITAYNTCTAWKFESYQTLKKVVAKEDSVQVVIPSFFAGVKTVRVAYVSEIWPSVDGTREYIFLHVTWNNLGMKGLFEIIGGVFHNLLVESPSKPDTWIDWLGGIWADGDNIFFIQGRRSMSEGTTLLRFNQQTKRTETFLRDGDELFGEKISVFYLIHNFEAKKLFILYSNSLIPFPRLNRLVSLAGGKLGKVIGSDSQIPVSVVGGIAENSYIRLLPIVRESNGKFVDTLGFQLVSEPEKGIRTLLKVGDSILGRPVERLDSDLVAVHGCNAEFATQKADGSPDRWYRFSFTCQVNPPVLPPEILGVANGASFDLNQPLAPGTIFSLFGKNLGTAESARVWPLPRKLGGAKITICGADAPLFASTGPMARPEGGQLWQINGVTPNIAASPNCEVVVSVDQKAPLQALTVKSSVKISSKPEETLALFTYTGFRPNGVQTQEPIITNQQGQLIAPPGVSIPGADPAMFTQARACEVITLWPTGGGRTIPSVTDGEPASSTSLARMEMSPVVQIYGVDTEILFAGVAPGFAGLYQINVRVPCEATPGEQWLWFGHQPNPGKVYKISIQ